jgi:hypothetical protein
VWKIYFYTQFLAFFVLVKNCLFDPDTLTLLCDLLDKSQGWVNLAELLDYGFLVPSIRDSASPSKMLFNYADVSVLIQNMNFVWWLHVREYCHYDTGSREIPHPFQTHHTLFLCGWGNYVLSHFNTHCWIFDSIYIQESVSISNILALMYST